MGGGLLGGARLPRAHAWHAAQPRRHAEAGHSNAVWFRLTTQLKSQWQRVHPHAFMFVKSQWQGVHPHAFMVVNQRCSSTAWPLPALRTPTTIHASTPSSELALQQRCVHTCHACTHPHGVLVVGGGQGAEALQLDNPAQKRPRLAPPVVAGGVGGRVGECRWQVHRQCFSACGGCTGPCRGAAAPCSACPEMQGFRQNHAGVGRGAAVAAATPPSGRSQACGSQRHAPPMLFASSAALHRASLFGAAPGSAAGGAATPPTPATRFRGR